jgi:hypothetical protein
MCGLIWLKYLELQQAMATDGQNLGHDGHVFKPTLTLCGASRLLWQA